MELEEEWYREKDAILTEARNSAKRDSPSIK
jgi:hypothetical protein